MWIAIFFFFNAFGSAYSNNLGIDSLVYGLETRATVSGGENTPFWMVSNLYGLGSPELNNGYVRGFIAKPLSSNNTFSWGIKADLVAAWNLPGAFRIQQLYAEIKYRYLWVSLGSREYIAQYNNRELSSGDLLFSGNSLPIPQLRIGTYGFAPFWGAKGWFSVKLYLSYGMFTDSKWQKKWVNPDASWASGVLYCSRGLWLRFGNKKIFPVNLDVGIEMGTQFGGTIHKQGKIIKMPHGPTAWVKAAIPFSGSKDTPNEEQWNIQGNMNGEYSINLSLTPLDGWEFRAYWEHYFEDQSQMTFEYGTWKDGLWGAEISFPQNKFISRIVYENICTRDQTGPVYNDQTPAIPEQISGRDDYYNHYLYGSWQTWGMVIGTPLVTSPLYNRNHNLSLYNNRITANHIGIEGQPYNFLSWRLLLTFSKNWGTYSRPLAKEMDNFSGLLDVSFYPEFIKGGFIKGSIAWDKGSLLGNNFGGFISLGYVGDFSISKK